MPSFPCDNSDSVAAARANGKPSVAREPLYWRVEGSLLDLTAVRPVAFFTWNAQSFLARWTRGVDKLSEALAAGEEIVLVSQALEHTMRPLANFLGVHRIVSNRLEFRNGLATGRLLSPVIRPRGVFAKLRPNRADGSVPRRQLVYDLGFQKHPDWLESAVRSAERPAPNPRVPVVRFDEREKTAPLSVRSALRGKHILLIGATGFIGKVWLANLLHDV